MSEKLLRVGISSLLIILATGIFFNAKIINKTTPKGAEIMERIKNRQ